MIRFLTHFIIIICIWLDPLETAGLNTRQDKTHSTSNLYAVYWCCLTNPLGEVTSASYFIRHIVPLHHIWFLLLSTMLLDVFRAEVQMNGVKLQSYNTVIATVQHTVQPYLYVSAAGADRLFEPGVHQCLQHRQTFCSNIEASVE